MKPKPVNMHVLGTLYREVPELMNFPDNDQTAETVFQRIVAGKVTGTVTLQYRRRSDDSLDIEFKIVGNVPGAEADFLLTAAAATLEEEFDTVERHSLKRVTTDGEAN